MKTKYWLIIYFLVAVFFLVLYLTRNSDYQVIEPLSVIKDDEFNCIKEKGKWITKTAGDFSIEYECLK